MKLLFSFLFLFFLSVQTQALFLIEDPNNPNMKNFDWEAFTNKEKIKEYTDLRDELFSLFGGEGFNGLRLDKIHLVRIEQELDLYKMGKKKGLSPEVIQRAEKTIALHWEDVNKIENQIKTSTGLGGSVAFTTQVIIERINEKDDYNGTWRLYRADYEIVLNMVEKRDKALYKALGSDDENYTEFITPYVEILLKKMRKTTEAYYNSLDGELDYETTRDISYGYYVDNISYDYYLEGTFKELNAISLTDIYTHSRIIYESFVKNFKNPTGRHQKELMNVLENWYKYQVLMGLTYVNAVADKDQEFYRKSIEKGIIEYHNTNYFSDHALSIPDVTKKLKEEHIITEKPTQSGNDLSFLDTSS